MSSRLCVFCGGTPVSREHAIPSWTIEEFGPHIERGKPIPGWAETGQEPWPHAARDGMMVDADGKLVPAVIALEPGRRAVRVDDVVVKAVCRTCNNGWMSALERAVAPTLRTLQRGDDRTLSEPEVRTLVRWSQKTALMLDRWAPPPRTFPAGVFEAVYRGEDELPGNWHIRLARADESCRGHFSHSPYLSGWIESDPETGRFKPGSLPHHSKRPIGVQCHFAIGRLAIMVRFIEHQLGPFISIDGDFQGLGSGAQVLLGEGATRQLWPRRWPNYDSDAWDNWDLWTPFPGAGNAVVHQDEDGRQTVVLMTPPDRPRLARPFPLSLLTRRPAPLPAVLPGEGWQPLSDDEPWL